jgi:hypothetical protein
MYAIPSLRSVLIDDSPRGGVMKNARRIALGVAIALLTAVPAFASSAGVSMTGGGSGILPDFFGPIAGDRLHVEFTARSLPDGTAVGRFHLVHQRRDGGIAADLAGTLDCLVSSNGQVSVTGSITSGHLPEQPGFDPVGQTVAITVVDQGLSDAVGVDLSFFGSPHTIAPCQAVYPYLSIDEGNFTVAT